MTPASPPSPSPARILSCVWFGVLLAALALAAAGCGWARVRAGQKVPNRHPKAIHPDLGHFTDVTGGAGIRFVHTNGATGKKYMPETFGSRCAFFDYDSDGWIDILLINGTPWPEARSARPTTMALYRNNRNGTFTDVTRRAGLAIPFYGIGCAVGDYDNDGHPDVYVTAALGPSHLFRNRGDGSFTDVTRAAGVDN